MKPTHRRRIVSFVSCMVVAFAVAFTSPASAIADTDTPDARQADPAPGERALVGRLVAPCCWQQTLDVHAGPMADALRAEVRRRLWAGEAAEVIEADFTARYGPRVRAVPDGNPIVGVALGLVVLSFFAAGGLFVVVRRWRRAAGTGASAPPSEAARDAYDERLDDELRAMSS
ncbi:cytochrome c-type biogenesis protein [Polyangium spumosum]|nr:cytochrome c-type biogenesis protein CcmH [Polyangium spumosum]